MFRFSWKVWKSTKKITMKSTISSVLFIWQKQFYAHLKALNFFLKMSIRKGKLVY